MVAMHIHIVLIETDKCTVLRKCSIQNKYFAACVLQVSVQQRNFKKENSDRPGLPHSLIRGLAWRFMVSQGTKDSEDSNKTARIGARIYTDLSSL